MSRRDTLVALAAISLSLLVLRGSSCVQVNRPYAAPTAAEVLASIKARASTVRSMRAETRMSHRMSQGKIKATVRMMAQRGGKIRFDAVTPFDTPLATFISDGKRFSLVDAQKNHHFHGPASPCNIARLLGVVLAADDVLTILGGSTPIIHHESATLTWDRRASAEVLTLKGPALTQTVRLDGSNRRWDLLFSEIRDRTGKVRLRIRTGALRRVGAVRLPGKIRIEQPAVKAELDIAFKRQEVNLNLPATAFSPVGAGGLPSQRVDCATKIKLEK